jgi:hypothetical protein
MEKERSADAIVDMVVNDPSHSTLTWTSGSV